MIFCATFDKPLLVLNCAEARVQIVWGTSKQLLLAQEIHCPGQSIVHLAPAIDQGLSTLAISIQDLAGLACVRGPGSFTGLRIAHATMYALARPWALPMAGLEYQEILALQADPLKRNEVWVLTYARKKQVYMQGFVQGQPLTTIKPLSIIEAMAILEQRPQSFFLVGSALAHNPELTQLHQARILPSFFSTPHPQVLLDSALGANFSSDPPVPLYLRKSDAEENLDAIADQRGLKVEDARKHIYDFE